MVPNNNMIGVRQGCLLLLIVSNVFLEKIPAEAFHYCANMNIKVNAYRLKHLRFAYDIACNTGSYSGLKIFLDESMRPARSIKWKLPF